MTNKFDEFRDAVKEAEYTLNAADAVAEKMAKLMVGRLHKADVWVLRKLKRELRGFDMVTGQWK